MEAMRRSSRRPSPADHDYIGDDDERTKALKSMGEVHELLERVAPHSISIVILASLKDAASLLKRNERLFVNKVRDVTIMGGVRWPVSSFAEPDSAHNNSFDMEASVLLQTVPGARSAIDSCR